MKRKPGSKTVTVKRSVAKRRSEKTAVVRKTALRKAVPSSTESAFAEVTNLIATARQHTFQAVNTVLIDLYWQVGEYISRKISSAEWGEGIVIQLARYLAREMPDLKGFSRPNLFRMRQFFERYVNDEKVSPLVRQLSWTHNLLILSCCKRPEEREFYIRLAVREHWGKRELERHLRGALFERAILSPPKVSALLAQTHPAVEQVFKDTYLVDFLDLPEGHSEGDLQRAIVANLRKFLIELGGDFCFVGEQYRLQVGGDDFLIDLLFFHRELQCLIAIELKVEAFQPEHLGKLNFYLEALDRDVKKPHEQASIGVLLCASKNDEVVEYALSRSLSPALVAEYQTRLPSKALLQRKLAEFYELETTRRQLADNG